MNNNTIIAKKNRNVFQRVFWFYVEGFKSMTIGKTLWLLVLIKLFIMFAILKVFFFKPVMSGMSEAEKENIVAEQLIHSK
jgi:hypothetical protein